MSGIKKRVQEARRMGFSRIVTPPDNRRKGPSNSKWNSTRKKSRKDAAGTGESVVTHEHGMERIQCRTVQAAINAGLVREMPKRRKRRSTKRPDVPGSLQDLDLDEIIMDDSNEDEDAVFL